MRDEFIEVWTAGHGYPPSEETVKRFLEQDYDTQQALLSELSYRKPGDRW